MKKKYISALESFDILKDSIKDIEEDYILINIKLNEIKFSLVNEINKEDDDELGWFSLNVFFLKCFHYNEFIKVVKLIIKHNIFKHKKFSNVDKENSLIIRNVFPFCISQN